MAYTIEMMRHFNKIPYANVTVSQTNTYTIPFRRYGVESPENPDKTRDEQIKRPLDFSFLQASPIWSSIMPAGIEILKGKKFTPEYLLNLRGVDLDGEFVRVSANYVNYGVLPALRELTVRYPEEVMLPVLKEIAPIAVRAVLVSEKHGSIYMARRANVSRSGKIDTYPAGTVSEGNNLTAALRKETKEEAGFRIDEDGTAYLIGLARGRSDAPNPNFIYIIHTHWSFEQIKKNTSAKEHDEVFRIELDDRKLREHIKNDIIHTTEEHDNIVDIGLAAILQTGLVLFGAKWYGETLDELRCLTSPKIKIMEACSSPKLL